MKKTGLYILPILTVMALITLFNHVPTLRAPASSPQCANLLKGLILKASKKSSWTDLSLSSRVFLDEVSGRLKVWNREFHFYVEQNIEAFENGQLTPDALLDQFEKANQKRRFRFNTIFSDNIYQKNYPDAFKQAKNKYDYLKNLTRAEIDNDQDLEHAVIETIQSFRILERNYRPIDFYIWLKNEHKLNIKEMKEKETLGFFLARLYLEFAPFVNDKKTRELFSDELLEKISKDITANKEEIERCGKDIDCLNLKTKNSLGSKYKQTFSCVYRNRDAEINFNSEIQLSLLTATGAGIFSISDPDLRFPWELLLATLTISPVFLEYYCRLNFKGDNLLGLNWKQLPKHNYRGEGLVKKMKTSLPLSTAAVAIYTSYIMLFDKIYELNGYEVKNKRTLEQHLVAFPFFLMYSGLWQTLRSIYIMSPIQLKILPAIAKNIQKTYPNTFIAKHSLRILNDIFKVAKSSWTSVELSYFFLGKILPYIVEQLGVDKDLNVTKEVIKTVDSESFTQDKIMINPDAPIQAVITIRTDHINKQMQIIDIEFIENDL